MAGEAAIRRTTRSKVSHLAASQFGVAQEKKLQTLETPSDTWGHIFGHPKVRENMPNIFYCVTQGGGRQS